MDAELGVVPWVLMISEPGKHVSGGSLYWCFFHMPVLLTAFIALSLKKLYYYKVATVGGKELRDKRCFFERSKDLY